MSRLVLACAAGLLAAAFAGGCPTSARGGPTLRTADLPADGARLVALVDDLWSRGDPVSLENSLFAAEHGRARAPKDVEFAWRAARACAGLADHPDVARADKIAFATRGVEHARAVLALADGSVAGYYYLAQNLGLRAQARAAAGAAGGLLDVPVIADAARKVLAADPSYDLGGGYRLLGMLLVRAPPWPASIGDIEEGVRLLEEGVKRFPDFPLNRLLLAEGLIEAAAYDRARAELDEVLAAPPAGEWARIGPRWRPRALELKEEIVRLAGGAGGGSVDGDGADDGELRR